MEKAVYCAQSRAANPRSANPAIASPAVMKLRVGGVGRFTRWVIYQFPTDRTKVTMRKHPRPTRREYARLVARPHILWRDMRLRNLEICRPPLAEDSGSAPSPGSSAR